MGSPYQQQAFQRKLIYIGAILVLLAGSWMWRHYLMAAQAESLALREESRGEADLIGAATRLSLTGMRGLATTFLWYTAMDRQKKNQWNELELIARSLTKLQPHFVAPWLFQGWNLAYNVSVEADAVNDRYFYISRGIALLGEGERQNHNQPRLRYELGFTYHHKIGMADDTNALRSIFQLSLIPPSERDPARFDREVFKWTDFKNYCDRHPDLKPKGFNWTELEKIEKADPKWFGDDHPWSDIESYCSTHRLVSDWREMEKVCRTGHLVRMDLNWEEFEKFCRTHPQLVRRLHQGILRTNKYEQNRQFTCRAPRDVVRFLADNIHVPSLYVEEPLARPGAWQRKDDRLLPATERFPLLPPHQDNPHVYSEGDEPLSVDSPLGDDVDAYSVSGAWFCYSLKAVPPPGQLPGEDQPITNRALQRRPHMTSVLFRAYPFHMRRYTSERLQEEGWFDGKGWIIPDWFKPVGDRFKEPVDGEKKDYRPLIGRDPTENAHDVAAQSSRDAWERTLKATIRYGLDNHLLLDSDPASQEEKERSMKRKAEQYHKDHTMSELNKLKMEDIDKLPISEKERDLYRAAKFMMDYEFCLGVGRFPDHLTRARVESQVVTVLARKQFSEANRLYLGANERAALAVYEKVLPELGNRNALDAWRDEVLKNRAFRDNGWTQEDTFSTQLRYMRTLDRLDLNEKPDPKTKRPGRMTGRIIRREVQKMSAVLPLVPPLCPTWNEKFFQAPVVAGPFDGKAPDGSYYIRPDARQRVLERDHLIPPTPPQGARGMAPSPGAPPPRRPRM